MVAWKATFTGALKDDGVPARNKFPIRHEAVVQHCDRKLFAKGFLYGMKQ